MVWTPDRSLSWSRTYVSSTGMSPSMTRVCGARTGSVDSFLDQIKAECLIGDMTVASASERARTIVHHPSGPHCVWSEDPRGPKPESDSNAGVNSPTLCGFLRQSFCRSQQQSASKRISDRVGETGANRGFPAESSV